MLLTRQFSWRKGQFQTAPDVPATPVRNWAWEAASLAIAPTPDYILNPMKDLLNINVSELLAEPGYSLETGKVRQVCKPCFFCCIAIGTIHNTS